MDSKILTVIFLSIFISIMKSGDKSKIESDGSMVLRFNKHLVAFFWGVSILMVTTTFVILFFAVSGKGNSDYFIIAAIFLTAFLLSIFLSLFFKRKKIIINGENICVHSMSGKIRNFTFEDIVKTKDNKNNNIVLYTKNNEKFSVDYQMVNFDSFKRMLNSRSFK